MGSRFSKRQIRRITAKPEAHGSSSSLSSRKKKPAPPPPPSLGGTMRSRKTKRAPLPPTVSPRRLIAAPEMSPDEFQPLEEDKSAAGRWKRRRAASPPRPVPPKRSVPPLPLPEIRRELESIEVQQRGLENQGVRLEQIIRERSEGGNPDDRAPPDVEDLILQLFELAPPAAAGGGAGGGRAPHQVPDGAARVLQDRLRQGDGGDADRAPGGDRGKAQPDHRLLGERPAAQHRRGRDHQQPAQSVQRAARRPRGPQEEKEAEEAHQAAGAVQAQKGQTLRGCAPHKHLSATVVILTVSFIE
ncbi:hypothetical protein D910_00837 [Dendroctonus ponderosae]|uniref:BMERB domain-containing protein n=1 Tax=Dendroctonus ponderosae TaxID=77166 RepID=U4TSD4_DENPD|nr:hypothetical protein D910_00837 [Dendroctonus ponderosae]